jgi:hypothetical protein
MMRFLVMWKSSGDRPIAASLETVRSAFDRVKEACIARAVRRPEVVRRLGPAAMPV